VEPLAAFPGAERVSAFSRRLRAEIERGGQRVDPARLFEAARCGIADCLADRGQGPFGQEVAAVVLRADVQL